ncbi:MAG: peptidoglycan bridge formation glycyltransferase FemA/FemB family protein [Candidatus Portnoybacteria bacterium]|nr:peptidoglycan bridge formation glycyltransferase FemA/FemB family protein [Candidatus Portnoybacteria bacterium]
MKTVSDNQKEEWDQFVIQNSGSFLQSWPWGEFQESLGRQIWRLETEGLKALLIKHNLPLGKSYLYCPRGPVGEISKDRFQRFLVEVKKIAQQEKSIFFKIEPQNNFQFSIFNFQISNKEIQPSKILILDITKPEEELLSRMHPKTRYNIRLAQKKGVTVEQSSEKIDDFLRLSKETAKRDKFHLHPQKYYQKMLEVLGQEGMVKLFLAKYQNQIVAANLVCFFSQTAFYLHGASDYNFRQLMAPHLCQWQGICQAKKLGLKYYDFWGIDEKKWPGVTRFKKGFAGQEINYPGAFDLVFQPIWYKIYSLARRIL